MEKYSLCRHRHVRLVELSINIDDMEVIEKMTIEDSILISRMDVCVETLYDDFKRQCCSW
jgi:hypothetical protein